MRLILLTIFCLLQTAMSSVLVVGDLEGDFPKFERFLKEQTEFFQYSPDTGWQILGDHQFVFMGDAIDKGPGGIKIVRVLSQMKKSQPENVTLLLGNRDVNKLMVYNLLKESEGLAPSEFLRVPYIQYLNENGMNLDLKMPLSELQDIVSSFDSEILRLKVILKGMNAAQAFEHRRQELKELTKLDYVSDKIVYDDFMKSLEKGGEFYEYLKHGEVIKVIDDTLFVHGGISNENIGKIPGKVTRYKNVKTWVNEMNKWAHSEILNWGEDYRRGNELLEYHAPRITGKNTKESVFYHRYSDTNGSPKMPSRSLIKKLRNSNIKRAVSAHTPIGEVATSVKTHDFEIIMSDVTSSTSRKLPLIKLDHDSSLIESTLSDGKKISSRTSGTKNLLPNGYLTNDGYRVVGRKGDDYLLLKFKLKGKEFVPEYIERSMDKIFKIGLKNNSERGFKSCLEVFNQALTR